MKKHEETVVVLNKVSVDDEYAPEFMSTNMLHVKHYAWSNGRYWNPSWEVIDAARCVKHCLERMGLRYE